MPDTKFDLTFRANAPNQLKVGDELTFTGKATVRAIHGDLVDITAIGSDPQFTLGETQVELYANQVEITPPSETSG